MDAKIRSYMDRLTALRNQLVPPAVQDLIEEHLEGVVRRGGNLDALIAGASIDQALKPGTPRQKIWELIYAQPSCLNLLAVDLSLTTFRRAYENGSLSTPPPEDDADLIASAVRVMKHTGSS